MYKICENIGCNTPFYVQRSNTIKKYCSESCKNASSQRRYRNKQKDFQ
ncbi:TPA: CGNR zinc finger domain-containing protein, partial [Streptococcus pyogenes]|nr:CGNR zinc finger domain-containing protein [Streptococcus pyogenes]